MSNFNFQTGSTVRNEYLQSSQPVNPEKTALYIGTANLPASGKVITDIYGNLRPGVYEPFNIGSFPDGITAANYLKNLGFALQLGKTYSSSTTPTTVSGPDTSTGLVTLTYSSVDTDYSSVYSLVGENPVGSVTQTSPTASTSSGTIYDVYTSSDSSLNYVNIVLSKVTGTFTAAAAVTITANLSALQTPDPAKSDDIVVSAFWFFEQGKNSFSYTSSPNLFLGYVPASTSITDITPSSTPIVITTTQSLTLLADGSYSLTLIADGTIAGIEKLPTNYFGNTIVTATTTATPPTNPTFIYNGMSYAGTSVIINLIPTSSSTSTATIPLASLSIVLDSSRSTLTMLGENEISAAGLFANIPGALGTSGNFSGFYNGVMNLRTPGAVISNKYNFQGYYGYYAGASPTVTNLSNYTSPDTPGFVHCVKLDVNGIDQSTITPGALVAAMMYNDINNEYPFYGTFGPTATLSIPASSNSATSPSVVAMNQLANQGCNVVGVNSAQQNYIFANLSCMQSVNGVPTINYRRQDIQLKTRWLDKNLVLAANNAVTDPITGQRLNNNEGVVSDVRSALLGILTTGYSNGRGILGNTANNVSVTLNPNDTSRLLASVSTTIVPANSGVDIVVYQQQFSI